MNDPYQIFTTILAIAGAVSAGAAVIFASRSRSLITLLKDENAALLGSNTRLDKENEVLKAQVTGAEAERDIWKNNVTQEPSIKILAAKTAQQHGEVLTALGQVASALAELTKVMSDKETKK